MYFRSLLFLLVAVSPLSVAFAEGETVKPITVTDSDGYLAFAVPIVAMTLKNELTEVAAEGTVSGLKAAIKLTITPNSLPSLENATRGDLQCVVEFPGEKNPLFNLIATRLNLTASSKISAHTFDLIETEGHVFDIDSKNVTLLLINIEAHDKNYTEWYLDLDPTAKMLVIREKNANKDYRLGFVSAFAE